MSLLDRIERAGNALPDPATLFLVGALLVMGLSHLAVVADWEVTKTVTRDGVQVEEIVRPQSLLTADGAYWAIESLVDNFKNFPPLAIVLVGMLGIGLADRTGFIGALLKAMLLAVPPRALTPTVFFVGVLSSLALDAGYVVLPPVAAALYAAVGRSPLAGLAAVFAGVAAGFSANLTVTSLDAILAGFSEAGARILDDSYAVAATANLWFMIASTFLLTGVGWLVTALWVEPRLEAKPPEEGGPVADHDASEHTLDETEKRGLRAGTIAEVQQLLSFASLGEISPVVRFLFAVRGAMGRLFGWEDEPAEPAVDVAIVPAEERWPVAPDLLARSLEEPGSRDGPFVVLYAFEREALSEIRNATVHAFSAMALERAGDGYRLHWAIYVRPVGRITSFYMALIAPFRRILVYPIVLRHVHRKWRERFGGTG